MGFVLTIVYLLSIHMALPEMFPALAAVRPQLTVAVLTTLATLPVLFSLKRPFPGPQIWLLSGFVLLVILSWLPRGYFGGVADTAQDFLPDVAAFFFVAVNVNTIKRLRILVIALILGTAITVGSGIHQYVYLEPGAEDDEDPPYVMVQRIGSETDGETLVLDRLRGLGVLNDPNDFSQYLLVLLPFVLLFWHPRKRAWSYLVVVPIGLLLLTGVYLTRSRGALLGLLALAWFLIRRNPKLIALGATGAAVFLIRFRASFTGGRDISLEGGSDRLGLWSDGFQMIRSSPLWGVGYRGYLDETGGLTAHNSFLLCAAEAGLPAYFLWVGLLIVTIIQLRALAYDEGPWAPDHETKRWSQALLVSMYIFLVTAFFLSRTFAPTLYALLGMCAALASMEARRRNTSPFPQFTWWPAWTVALGSALLALIYTSVRIGNALRG